jgi:predicted AlkP superfamily pyrophosphatase or phosphodiesterase
MAERTPELDWIESAAATRRLMMTATRDSLTVLARNSVFPGRNPGVLGRFGVALRMTNGTLDWAWPRGTTHGSPYHYDRHVPLIFMGPGIAPGRDAERVASVDIAPTLAEIMGIEPPEGLDGRVLRLAP